MLLEIITPGKKLYEGEVDSVKLPGSEGSFGILNNHAPVISSLKEGTIEILQADSAPTHFDELSGKIERDTKNDTRVTFEVTGGIVEMNNNKIIILAE